MVVDPSYAIEAYLEEAERLGVRIVRVLETHTHADHLSGHGRLALEHGLPVSIHPLAEPAYAFDPVEDGDELQIGDVAIRVIHTPGHRPEHCCYLADGHLLTGDSLLIGDAARPDLAVDSREGAESMYASLRRLAELPEDTEVDPGHVAGSLCATGISAAHSSTIGLELKTNRALSYHGPPGVRGRDRNGRRRRGRRRPSASSRSTGPVPRSLSPLEPLESFDGQLLDVRSPHEFAAGHVAGALNVPVSRPVSSARRRASCSTRSGRSRSTLLRASRQTRRPPAARGRAARPRRFPDRARRDRADGADRARRARTPAGRRRGRGRSTCASRTSATTAISRAAATSRTGSWARTRRAGNGRPLVTVCATGARAGVAASALRSRAHARPLLDGGMADWQARGNAVTAFRRCGGSG